jgi:hypothetical protein
VRAVLDSNVLVSAAISPRGAAAAVVVLWRRGGFENVASPPLLAEFARTIEYPRVTRFAALSTAERATFVREVESGSRIVTPEIEITASRDPDDNRVLEAAVTGRVDYIVSGDRDLLDLESFEGIPIVPPRRFLEILEARNADD